MRGVARSHGMNAMLSQLLREAPFQPTASTCQRVRATAEVGATHTHMDTCLSSQVVGIVQSLIYCRDYTYIVPHLFYGIPYIFVYLHVPGLKGRCPTDRLHPPPHPSPPHGHHGHTHTLTVV